MCYLLLRFRFGLVDRAVEFCEVGWLRKTVANRALNKSEQCLSGARCDTAAASKLSQIILLFCRFVLMITAPQL
jgi:predicted metal-dependent hydrolase